MRSNRVGNCHQEATVPNATENSSLLTILLTLVIAVLTGNCQFLQKHGCMVICSTLRGIHASSFDDQLVGCQLVISNKD